MGETGDQKSGDPGSPFWGNRSRHEYGRAKGTFPLYPLKVSQNALIPGR